MSSSDCSVLYFTPDLSSILSPLSSFVHVSLAVYLYLCGMSYLAWFAFPPSFPTSLLPLLDLSYLCVLSTFDLPSSLYVYQHLYLSLSSLPTRFTPPVCVLIRQNFIPILSTFSTFLALCSYALYSSHLSTYSTKLHIYFKLFQYFSCTLFLCTLLQTSI